MSRILQTFVLLVASQNGYAETSESISGSYSVDPYHGYILFSYNHMGLSNPSVGFNTFTVDLNFNAADPSESAVSVLIDANSIDSRVPVFDEHLVGEDFFNVVEYPDIAFEVTSIEPKAEDTYWLAGDLTMKGITNSIRLEATIVAKEHPMKKIPAIGLSATGSLKRSEWDLGLYAPAVSDEVALTIEVEMLKN